MSSVMEQLETYGPSDCPSMSEGEARKWCRELAQGQYENFSVLSSLVPLEKRDDFAAVYAFCRWADDLGDEAGDRDRSRELLQWWGEELHACYEGQPRHPVFVALQPTIQRYDLPIDPFADLIDAFEQDQEMQRYQSWDELLAYCRRSANPVGRLVLMLCEEGRTESRFAASDAICTALQLTNHWQDVKRDLLERDRIYIPNELIEIDDFETRFRATANQGYAVDHAFLEESRKLIKTCCDRTWKLYESGGKLLEQVGPTTRPIVWLLASGGQHVLRMIEMWNYETVLHRPKLGLTRRLTLVARAWLSARFSHTGRPETSPGPGQGEGGK